MLNLNIGTDHCTTPQELLESPSLAIVLSLYNRSHEESDVLWSSSMSYEEIATPEKVANDPGLAEKVLRFWERITGNDPVTLPSRRSYPSLTINIENIPEKLSQVIEATIEYVKERSGEVLRKDGIVKIPKWIKSIVPRLQIEDLPIEAVRALEIEFQRSWAFSFHSKEDAVYAMKTALCHKSNNFVPFILERLQKNAREIPATPMVRGQDCSDLMKTTSWADFHTTVSNLMEKYNLTLEECRQLQDQEDREKGAIDASIYMLPVFLELVRMGYKIYPDLSV